MKKTALATAIGLSLTSTVLLPAHADSNEQMILAAMDGNVKAQFTVGQWYETGKGPLMLDLREAYICYYLAAQQNHHRAEAKMLEIEKGYSTKWIQDARKEGKQYGCGAAALAGCFITTAVCEYLNKPDDCYELQTLRWFRDHILASQHEGRQDIQRYYDIAPGIVTAIEQQADRHVLYQGLLQQHILPAVSAIEQQRYDRAYLLYRAMTLGLYDRFV